jgi:hypothetical protein
MVLIHQFRNSAQKGAEIPLIRYFGFIILKLDSQFLQLLPENGHLFGIRHPLGNQDDLFGFRQFDQSHFLAKRQIP